MRTVEATSPVIGLPHALLSFWRAAAKPSKKTSGEPAAIGLTPWPGRGQEVGSVTRAAGLPDIMNFLVKATVLEMLHNTADVNHGSVHMA